MKLLLHASTFFTLNWVVAFKVRGKVIFTKNEKKPIVIVPQ